MYADTAQNRRVKNVCEFGSFIYVQRKLDRRRVRAWTARELDRGSPSQDARYAKDVDPWTPYYISQPCAGWRLYGVSCNPLPRMRNAHATIWTGKSGSPLNDSTFLPPRMLGCATYSRSSRLTALNFASELGLADGGALPGATKDSVAVGLTGMSVLGPVGSPVTLARGMNWIEAGRLVSEVPEKVVEFEAGYGAVLLIGPCSVVGPVGSAAMAACGTNWIEAGSELTDVPEDVPGKLVEFDAGYGAPVPVTTGATGVDDGS